MDIDYSKFEIRAKSVMRGTCWWVLVRFDGFQIDVDGTYTTKRAAIRGAKRAIKRIVETAMGDK